MVAAGAYITSDLPLATQLHQAMQTAVSALTVVINTVSFIVSSCLYVTRSRFAGGRLLTLPNRLSYRTWLRNAR